MAEGEDEQRTYTSAEVCRAVGLPRSTFDAWLLRQFLPLPLGPGTGRSRSYSLLDAVRIAVVAELTKQGISVGIAGRLCGLILKPFSDPRTALLLASTATTREAYQAGRCPAAAIVQFTSFDQIARTLRFGFVNGAPATFTMMDVRAIADRTRAALEQPESVPTLDTWLDNQDPAA